MMKGTRRRWTLNSDNDIIRTYCLGAGEMAPW